MSELDSEKLYYERFFGMLSYLNNDRQLKAVFDKYGASAFRRSSVLEGFEGFVVENKFRGETVVEIGTLKGLTSIVLARYFERVVTVDIVSDEEKYEIAHFLGVDNIRFINVADNHEKAAVLASYAFDAAYMDGDHKNDSAEDFKILKRCGRVLAHEFWDAQPVVEKTLRAAGGKLVTGGKFALWTL